MSKPTVSLLLLFFIGTSVFLMHYKFTDAYIDTPDHLAIELRSPLDSAYVWQISKDVPFKYRMLFPVVVKATWAVFRHDPQDNESFVAIYRIWIYLFYLTAIFSFCWLLRVLGFSTQQVFAGGLIFILLPPMSFAFAVPVHTREDLLCYTILHLGLIAFLKEKKWLFMLLSLAAVFCRETLLILPLLYFFYAKEKFFMRVLICGIPGVAWLLMRWITYEKYDAVGDGLGDNLENLFQTCAFLFLSFNIMWLPFFSTLMSKKEIASRELAMIFKTAWPAFLLIFFTTILLGRVMEIRLLYLLAPWIIPVVVYGVSQHRVVVTSYFRTGTFIFLAVGGLLFLTAGYLGVWKFRPELYLMIEWYWWGMLFLCTLITIISLPLLRPLMQGPPAVTPGK